jgi:hypothetical protein
MNKRIPRNAADWKIELGWRKWWVDQLIDMLARSRIELKEAREQLAIAIARDGGSNG